MLPLYSRELIVLYFAHAIRFHDVDNRIKDVLDALQGRLIPNDRQVFKVTVTKMLPPPQSRTFGHVTITKHRN